MKFARTIVVGTLLCLILSPGFVRAQKGIQLGFDFPLASFPFGDFNFSPGLGAGLKVGYGFDDRLSIWFDAATASGSLSNSTLRLTNSQGYSYRSEDWNVGRASFDGKYFINDDATVRPFVIGGIGVGELIGDSNDNMTGLALTAGGGAEYFLSDRWSLNGTGLFWHTSLTRALINGTETDLRSSSSESAITLNLGVTYHF